MKRTAKRIRPLIMALFVCSLVFAMYSVASAEENNGLLRDQGVEELNSAYEYTIDTERDSVGASAGISSGGWSSLGSSLSGLLQSAGSQRVVHNLMTEQQQKYTNKVKI